MQTEHREEELGEPCEKVTREIEIEAPAEQVWETLTTNEGREQWLERDPNRVIIVEHEEPCQRIAWWWWNETEPARHVDIRVVGTPTGTRVIVTETAPASLPLAAMAAACTSLLVAA